MPVVSNLPKKYIGTPKPAWTVIRQCYQRLESIPGKPCKEITRKKIMMNPKAKLIEVE
jgi:hypothetical protein